MDGCTVDITEDSSLFDPGSHGWKIQRVCCHRGQRTVISSSPPAPLNTLQHPAPPTPPGSQLFTSAGPWISNDRFWFDFVSSSSSSSSRVQDCLLVVPGPISAWTKPLARTPEASHHWTRCIPVHHSTLSPSRCPSSLRLFSPLPLNHPCPLMHHCSIPGPQKPCASNGFCCPASRAFCLDL